MTPGHREPSTQPLPLLSCSNPLSLSVFSSFILTHTYSSLWFLTHSFYSRTICLSSTVRTHTHARPVHYPSSNTCLSDLFLNFSSVFLLPPGVSVTALTLPPQSIPILTSSPCSLQGQCRESSQHLHLLSCFPVSSYIFLTLALPLSALNIR